MMIMRKILLASNMTKIIDYEFVEQFCKQLEYENILCSQYEFI